jgi:class 3 adenylate cyclase
MNKIHFSESVVSAKQGVHTTDNGSSNKRIDENSSDPELERLKRYFQDQGLLSAGPTELFPSSVPMGLLSTLTDKTIRTSTNAKVRKLEFDLIRLKTQYVEVLTAKEKNDQQLGQLKDQIAKMQGLSHVIKKVEPKAQELLFDSEQFVSLFGNDRTCNAFVVSVDLRKSTTLMLKARDSKQFAVFLTSLCDRLYDTILKYHGVFDKFTGDGILAFFPDFYSGDDAGFLALTAATECHEIFRQEYKNHRSGFVSILSDVGLGIGIDFGLVTLVSLWGGLTVVGSPVVYACRMGSAPAGLTFLNQPAFEIAFGKYSGYCTFSETTIDIKGEGQTIAYDVRLNGKSYQPRSPDWLVQLENKTIS